MSMSRYAYTDRQLRAWPPAAAAAALWADLQNEKANNLVLRGRVNRLVAIIEDKEIAK